MADERVWFERLPAVQGREAVRRLAGCGAVIVTLLIFELADDLIEGFTWSPSDALTSLLIAASCVVFGAAAGAHAGVGGSRLLMRIAQAIVAVAGAQALYGGAWQSPLDWPVPWNNYQWWPERYVYSVGLWWAIAIATPLWPVAFARRREARDVIAFLAAIGTLYVWSILRSHGGPGSASLITALVVALAFAIAANRRFPALTWQSHASRARAARDTGGLRHIGRTDHSSANS